MPGGTLDVTWQGAERYGSFALRWREANDPAPGEAHRSGFGTMMNGGMIEKQLRGRFQRDWTEDGVVITLTVPGGVEAVGGPAPP
jgi:hypothetical protein